MEEHGRGIPLVSRIIHILIQEKSLLASGIPTRRRPLSVLGFVTVKKILHILLPLGPSRAKPQNWALHTTGVGGERGVLLQPLP